MFTKRIIAIAIVIVSIAIMFYLYLPPYTSEIDTMNKVVGIQKLDVLCVGSSHMFCGINPIQMYEDKGIAAYDLAVGAQSPWQSYFYIREACKNQSPQVIILDTYMIGCTQSEDDYQDYQTVRNLLYFPLSGNKIKALMESKANSRLGILLVFPYTYDNTDDYPGLTVNKRILKDDSCMMGYSYNSGVESYPEPIDAKAVETLSPLSSRNELYLRRIIEYCEDEDMDLILTNTPWPCITEEKQEYFNTIGLIAQEYDIPFIDGCCLYKDMDIDYTTDSYGDGGHLNYNGVTKYTSWIEEFLEENYTLPDRRGDTEYKQYERGVEMLDTLIHQEQSNL